MDNHWASGLCTQMAWETGFQTQVESYQRLKKLYLIHPCLILSIIKYVSGIKWSLTLFTSILLPMDENLTGTITPVLVELGVMSIKRNTTLPTSPELEP